MSSQPLRMLVADLLAAPGESRMEEAVLPLDLELTAGSVVGDALVSVRLRSLTDGIVAKGAARVEARLSCTRCLVEWTEVLEVPVEQVYRLRPEDTDDELPVEQRQWIDLEPVVRDEVALALPAAPLCHQACRGLCPRCGTDLNTDPCTCDGDEPRSPFAALKQLFEP